MKSLLVFISVPFFSFAQDFNSALNFHNTIRGYYDLKPLTIDEELTDIAYNRVQIIAEADEIVFTNDSLGESVFFTDYKTISRDYFLEASIAFAIENDNDVTLKQLLCKDCESLGFGISVTDEKIWVVIKYDKVYEEKQRKAK